MRRRSLLTAPFAFQAAKQVAQAAGDVRVYAFGDGVPLSPDEYSQLLARLTSNSESITDDYSRGGVVEKLEARMAAILAPFEKRPGAENETGFGR